MSHKNEERNRLSVLLKIASGEPAVFNKLEAMEVLEFIDELELEVAEWRRYAKHPDSVISKFEAEQAAVIRSQDSTHNYNRHLGKMLKKSEAIIKELKQELSTLRLSNM